MSKLIKEIDRSVRKCIRYDYEGDAINDHAISRCVHLLKNIHPHILKMIQIAEMQVELMEFGFLRCGDTIEAMEIEDVIVEFYPDLAIVVTFSTYDRRIFHYSTTTWQEDLTTYIRGLMTRKELHDIQ